MDTFPHVAPGFWHAWDDARTSHPQIAQSAIGSNRSSDCGKRVARKNRVWQRPVEERCSFFRHSSVPCSFNRDGSGSRTYRVHHDRPLCSVSMLEPTLISPRPPNGVAFRKQSSGHGPCLHVVHLGVCSPLGFSCMHVLPAVCVDAQNLRWRRDFPTTWCLRVARWRSWALESTLRQVLSAYGRVFATVPSTIRYVTMP